MSEVEPLSRRKRLRVARGPKRPVYLGDPDLDRVAMMLTALMGEVSALRDRIDTHEEIAGAGIAATGSAIEAFKPSEESLQRRSELREAMLNRVYRVLFEELELARRKEMEGSSQ
jgi:hypothetical protein